MLYEAIGHKVYIELICGKSPEFREKWNTFLKTAGCIHVSADIIHKEIILLLHPIEETQLDSAEEATLVMKNA